MLPQHRPVETQSKAQMIFLWLKAKTKQQLMAKKKAYIYTHTHTHTRIHARGVSRTSCHVRLPAQTNIWLTLESGYYLAKKSVNGRSGEGGGGFHWLSGFPSSYLFFFSFSLFNLSLQEHRYLLAVTRCLSGTQERSGSLPGSLAKSA